MAKQRDSPNLLNFTDLKMATEYKKIIFDLINNLHMAHHTPGQKVIKQNDEVVDADGHYIDEEGEQYHVFFIMTGNYSVQSLSFDVKKRVQDRDAKGNDISYKKGLRSGDFFGEVSVIFGCRRTATVKAKQYCEASYIKNEEFLQLLANYNILKRFLVRRLMQAYDDELRIFLVSCLKEIDYFKGISQEILIHIALHMIPEPADKDQVIHHAKDFARRQACSEMKILYKGKIALTL